jgi:hypothetical protein
MKKFKILGIEDLSPEPRRNDQRRSTMFTKTNDRLNIKMGNLGGLNKNKSTEGITIRSETSRKSKRHSSTHSHVSHFTSRSNRSRRRKKTVKIEVLEEEEVFYRNNNMVGGGKYVNKKVDLNSLSDIKTIR